MMTETQIAEMGMTTAGGFSRADEFAVWPIAEGGTVGVGGQFHESEEQWSATALSAESGAAVGPRCWAPTAVEAAEEALSQAGKAH